MDISHRTHLPLPAGLLLLDRTPRGWERDAVELVAIPADTDIDTVVDAQRRAAAAGRLGPHTVGILLQRATSRRVPARQLAEAVARGRRAHVTETVDVWEPHRVIDGRPGPILGLHDRFDDALRTLLRR